MFNRLGSTMRIINIEFRRKVMNLFNGLVRRELNMQHRRIDNVDHFPNLVVKLILLFPPAHNQSCFHATLLRFTQSALIFPKEAQDDIMPRTVTKVKCPGWFFPQILQKLVQTCSDQVGVLHAVMPHPILTPRQELTFKQTLQICKRRTSKKRPIWHTTQQWHVPILAEGLGHVVFGLVILLRQHFVDDYASYAHAVCLTMHAIQFQLIKGATEPTVRHQHHIRVQHCCDLRIIQIDNRPDRYMTSTLAQHNIRVDRKMFIGILYALHLQLVFNLPVDVIFGISTWNDHRGHVFIIQMVQFEMFLHQTYVFIYADGLGAL
mmetsp:Transcript_15676/g.24398  ORF Transcript_15676/g.24398 Transcript_15676/m.24398 type:complete len:320 (+) Transcript_15676:162-1121(+)